MIRLKDKTIISFPPPCCSKKGATLLQPISTSPSNLLPFFTINRLYAILRSIKQLDYALKISIARPSQLSGMEIESE